MCAACVRARTAKCVLCAGSAGLCAADAHREVVLHEGGLDEEGLLRRLLHEGDHQLALCPWPHLQQPQLAVRGLGQQALLPHSTCTRTSVSPSCEFASQRPQARGCWQKVALLLAAPEQPQLAVSGLGQQAPLPHSTCRQARLSGCTAYVHRLELALPSSLQLTAASCTSS